MAKRKTKSEYAKWLLGHIGREFGGNKAEASRAFGEERQVLYDVINEHRSPTKRILAATAHKKVPMYEKE